MVNMRLMRAMIVCKISPPQQPKRQVPSFMVKTTLQKASTYPSLVDYFAWPDFRDYLIRTGIRNISPSTATTFVTNFRFAWAYDLSDTYMDLKATGRFEFSKAFTESFHRLDSYRVTPWDGIGDLLPHLG